MKERQEVLNYGLTFPYAMWIRLSMMKTGFC